MRNRDLGIDFRGRVGRLTFSSNDFAAVGEALNVAVQLIKRRPRDVPRAKCRVDVKAGNRRNGGVFTLGLGEHKPIRPKPEGVASLRFGCLVVP